PYCAPCACVLSAASFHAPPPAALYPLSLHDALPIFVTLGLGLWLIVRPLASLSALVLAIAAGMVVAGASRLSDSDRPLPARVSRSEEHTSELQSRENLVCRLLLEKKKETMRACASGR